MSCHVFFSLVSLLSPVYFIVNNLVYNLVFEFFFLILVMLLVLRYPSSLCLCSVCMLFCVYICSFQFWVRAYGLCPMRLKHVLIIYFLLSSVSTPEGTFFPSTSTWLREKLAKFCCLLNDEKVNWTPAAKSLTMERSHLYVFFILELHWANTGSHFGLPPSEIDKMTGQPPKVMWTMNYSISNSHMPDWIERKQ